MLWESLKQYIPVAVHWDRDGKRDYNDNIVPDLTPTCLYPEAGGSYAVDRIREDGMQPSFVSGGYGVRYTARTSCEKEENYNKVFYLYFEAHGQLGRWRCGDQYISADVMWGADGVIFPTSFYLDDHKYVIEKHGILVMYRMSTRKTDGSGMRYIVKATCRELRDYNREFPLMLENGGAIAGRWYYEDADAVHRRRVKYAELDDGSFDHTIVEEAMGVSRVCARFQMTIDVANFLREWNSRDHDGIWLSPEVFEKRVKDGIIYPKDYYPVMIAEGGEIVPSVMQWGLERSWASGVIFNLRCDKLAEKKTFEKIKGNRCVIPCGGFYEYQKSGKTVIANYLFETAGQDTMYLAGLYESCDNGSRYAVITTDANNSCSDIHDRMPVILGRGECRAWLTGKLDFAQIGDRKGVRLHRQGVR